MILNDKERDKYTYTPNIQKYANTSELWVALIDGQLNTVYHYKRGKNSLYLNMRTNQIYTESELTLVKSFSEYVKENGFEVSLEKTNGEIYTELPVSKVRQIDNAIILKQTMVQEQNDQIKNISLLVVNYVSDLLGFNIINNPSTNLSDKRIANVLVAGTKVKKFKQYLSSLIEFDLYNAIYGDNMVIMPRDQKAIDYRILRALNKANIPLTDNVSFRIRFNADCIMISIDNEKFATYYDRSEAKTKKIGIKR